MSGDKTWDFEPSKNHWTVKGFREKVSKKEMQDVMRNRPDPIVNGIMREWKYEKIAPDVYEIWISEEPKHIE